jgi:AraC family transcriptional regulator of adaptative response/methylated-DNA-[protein]-cysteine methyltransferase
MTASRPSHAALAERVQADPRWALLLARDESADGQFVYSVSSTGVYCRPSCRARRPRPEHVAFHDSASAAERLGFRACKRCRPHQASRREQASAEVAALCRLIDGSEDPPTLAQLAAHIGRSRFETQRRFKAVTGISPKAYAQAARADRLRQSLSAQKPVTEALYAAGFGSSSRLYEASAALLGMTPRQYRAGGSDQTIAFAVGRSTLGWVLVAATEKGLCAVWLGDDRMRLLAELGERFPRAQIVEGRDDLALRLDAVLRRIDDPAANIPSLPIDIRGTAFQQRVWQALQQIPSGQTRSYRQIACAVGQPRASRAVAQACARNPLAVLIPCHRVVREGGALSGYRWGVARKQALLQAEARSQAARPEPPDPQRPRRRP